MENNKHIYYIEGDICPSCKKGMLIFMRGEWEGETSIKCQDCFYDATEDKKVIK